MGAVGAHRAEAGRLPRAAAVVGGAATVRVLPGRRRAAAAATGGVAVAHRRGAARGPVVHAVAVPRRAALRLRRELVSEEPLTWLDLGEDVLAFDRGPALRCVVDISGRPVPLGGLGRTLLTSEDVGGELPPDTAARLAPAGPG